MFIRLNSYQRWVDFVQTCRQHPLKGSPEMFSAIGVCILSLRSLLLEH